MSSGWRRASIDLGTHTCLLLIGEGSDGAQPSQVRTVEDHASIVRLGEGVDRERKLGPAAMDRALDCLKTYRDHVIRAGLRPEETRCVATSQARDAANGAEFFERVRRETGFRFRVIPGSEEARCSFLGGLLPGMRPEASVIIDIGGGSTELMDHEGNGRSLDVGSVRFTERYLKSDPVTDEEFWRCQEAVDAELSWLSGWRRGLRHGDGAEGPQLVGVAGTVTTLASWHLGLERFSREEIDRVTLTRGDVHRMVEELKWRTVAERAALPGVEPARAPVILAGALILWRVMGTLDFATCRVSTRGLRYGVLV